MASALVVPLYVFFPVYGVLLDVMHGMTRRTRVPKTTAASRAFSEYTNDAVCGAFILVYFIFAPGVYYHMWAIIYHGL